MNIESSPQIPYIGQLSLVEVYEYYDKPLLFSCRNTAGQLYLAVLSDESDSLELWYFVGVSQNRFAHVRSGAIDLYTAIKYSEDGYVLEVAIPLEIDRSEIEVRNLSALSISDDRLPIPGEALDISTETLPAFLESTVVKAEQTRREFFTLALTFMSIQRTEAPAKLLGGILEAVQETVDAIGQALQGDITRRGAVPANIRSQMELMVTGVGSGSFEVELASTEVANLFNETDVGDAIRTLIDLLRLGNDEELLKQRLEILQIRVAAKYAGLLNALTGQVQFSRFEWASPRHDVVHEATITSEIAQEIVSIIERTEFEPPVDFTVKGQLIGANLNRKNYEIWSRDEEGKLTTYAGRISDSALESVTGAVLEREYTAFLRQFTSLNPVTGEIEDRYELLRLS